VSEGSPSGKQIAAELERLHKEARSAAKNVEEREHIQTWWFGVGLGAFVILISGDLGSAIMQSVPPILTSLLLTFALGTGATLAFSRGSLRLSKRKIQGLGEETNKNREPIPKLLEETRSKLWWSGAWSKASYGFLVATFVLGIAAVAMFLTSAWQLAVYGWPQS
jgi:hypothetical protein